MKGWIFDLRDNPDGYVSAAQDVLGLFPKVKDACIKKCSNQQSFHGKNEFIQGLEKCKKLRCLPERDRQSCTKGENSKTANKQLKITPVKRLNSDASYLLIVKNHANKKDGLYFEVTVK